MKKYDAVIAGYLCVDLIPSFKREKPVGNISELLKPGKLIEIDGLSYTPGGAVANMGMVMKKFSKNVFLNGLIGDDLIGKIALMHLTHADIVTGVKVMKGEGTAFGFVIAPPGIDRIFLESPGCSHLFDIRHIDFDAVAQSRLFHFGYPPLLKQFYLNEGAQLIELFAVIQEMGVVTSLDLSLPDPESESGKINWPEIIKRVLPYTDIFVPSLEEALQIMMPDKYAAMQLTSRNADIIDLVTIPTIREIGKRIIDAGVKIAFIKAGHRGAYLLTGDVSSLNEKTGFNLQKERWNNQELWCNAFPIDTAKVKNASGAGDTASAAFLAAILDGEDAEHSLKYAAMAGRNCLYCTDIYRELDDWAQMREELKSVSVKISNLKLAEYNDLPDLEMAANEWRNL